MGTHKIVKELSGAKVSVPSGKRILLHICCAPCATFVRKKLEEGTDSGGLTPSGTNKIEGKLRAAEVSAPSGFKVTGFFYNPNIHPYTEYEKRLMSLKLYASLTELPMIYEENYELEDFMEEIEFGKLSKRCEMCYRLRLQKTAQAARAGGFDYFTTTLLISPYQKHETLKKIGEEIGKEYGVKFYYEDFRKGFADSQKMARQMNLYRQKYCGCIFSEKEAFFKK